MGRKPTSINLEEDHRRWMEEENINRSEFVNDLISRYRENDGRMEDVIRQYQIQQLRSEIEAERSKVESKEQRLERLLEEQEEQSHQKQAELSEAKEALENAPRDPTNPAIKNWADQLGMTPKQLIDELDGGDSE